MRWVLLLFVFLSETSWCCRLVTGRCCSRVSTGACRCQSHFSSIAKPQSYFEFYFKLHEGGLQQPKVAVASPRVTRASMCLKQDCESESRCLISVAGANGPGFSPRRIARIIWASSRQSWPSAGSCQGNRPPMQFPMAT